MQLKKLRKKIDEIDFKVVKLLNRRANLAKTIHKLKSRVKKGVFSPEREKQILRRISDLNKGPLPDLALEAIYREIMSSSLSLEKPLKIAYLGPQASFTHIAALKKFGTQVTCVSCNSITDIFVEVEKELSSYGVVPIENSIEGVITHSLDMFIDSDLKICDQILLEVSHNLIGSCSKSQIKKIYSNPQVFGQCRIWLKTNMSKAEWVEVSSTTRAAQICATEKNAACIASILAARQYGLKIIAKDIEDSAHNITRFLVVGKEDVSPTGDDKTSIMFSIKDRVGALHNMLAPFKKYKINLTKIESRPSKKKAWDYYFFVDLEGHRRDKKVQKALSELEHKCKFLKILGSYPVVK